MYSRRLQVQERLTRQIAEVKILVGFVVQFQTLSLSPSQALHNTIKPSGVAVVIEAA
jgi:GTP cyclohydrolase I